MIEAEKVLNQKGKLCKKELLPPSI